MSGNTSTGSTNGATAQVNSTVAAGIAAPNATGSFSISNGQIIGPDGSPFIAKGIDIYDSQMSTVSTSSAGDPLLNLFPGINMIRLACESYDNSAALEAFITTMTSKGIVVEIEDHTAPSSTSNVLTGSALTTELNWYSSLATTFANNPYVWFGTMNEPNDVGNESAVTSQEASIQRDPRGWKQQSDHDGADRRVY